MREAEKLSHWGSEARAIKQNKVWVRRSPSCLLYVFALQPKFGNPSSP